MIDPNWAQLFAGFRDVMALAGVGATAYAWYYAITKWRARKS